MSASEATNLDLDLVINCTGGDGNGTMQLDNCGGNATNISGKKDT